MHKAKELLKTYKSSFIVGFVVGLVFFVLKISASVYLSGVLSFLGVLSDKTAFIQDNLLYSSLFFIIPLLAVCFLSPTTRRGNNAISALFYLFILFAFGVLLAFAICWISILVIFKMAISEWQIGL